MNSHLFKVRDTLREVTVCPLQPLAGSGEADQRLAQAGLVLLQAGAVLLQAGVPGLQLHKVGLQLLKLLADVDLGEVQLLLS